MDQAARPQNILLETTFEQIFRAFRIVDQSEKIIRHGMDWVKPPQPHPKFGSGSEPPLHSGELVAP
jgi:hypothetical protein